MDEITGRVHSVETFGALDGPGIRYVLFLQGCPLRCIYCHNPDSWSFGCGKPMSVGEVMCDLQKYRNFIKSGGITLSGGEPLMQSRFCAAIIAECKTRGIHTAIDTSGVVSLDICEDSVREADLLLLDIKALDPELARKITGFDNYNALKMLDYRESVKKPVWIRHVLLNGYTMEEKPLRELAQFLSGYSVIEKIELLPFHKMGEYKWSALDLTYSLGEAEPPSKEQIAFAKGIMREYGLAAP